MPNRSLPSPSTRPSCSCTTTSRKLMPPKGKPAPVSGAFTGKYRPPPAIQPPGGSPTSAGGVRKSMASRTGGGWFGMRKVTPGRSEEDRVGGFGNYGFECPRDEDLVPDLENQNRPDPPGVIRFAGLVRIQHGQDRGRVEILVGLRRGDDRPGP